MKWIPLTKEDQLNDIIEKSSERPQVIFKYSSRCSLSDMIKDRLERKNAPEGIDFYFLDIIAYRAISGKIATRFHVHHESPQVLLIRNGQCVYDESHAGIRMDEIVEQTINV
jgi:bacillithiol system protein YtxJ